MCVCIYIYIYIYIKAASRISFGDHPLKIGAMQRRLAWPLRKDDMHKSRSDATCKKAASLRSSARPGTDRHPDVAGNYADSLTRRSRAAVREQSLESTVLRSEQSLESTPNSV